MTGDLLQCPSGTQMKDRFPKPGTRQLDPLVQMIDHEHGDLEARA